MSRAVMLDSLLQDPRLTDPLPTGLGLNAESILVNYDSEQRPTDEIFIVLGWMPEQTGLVGDDNFTRPIKNLTVWVHMYKEFGTDFTIIDTILDIIDDIYENIIHVTGADGQTVSQVVKVPGRSRDMRDDAYQTMCRSASYQVLNRIPATV